MYPMYFRYSPIDFPLVPSLLFVAWSQGPPSKNAPKCLRLKRLVISQEWRPLMGQPDTAGEWMFNDDRIHPLGMTFRVCELENSHS